MKSRIGVVMTAFAAVIGLLLLMSGSAHAGSTLLKRGSTGADVVKLQERLASLGYLPGSADGSYGGMTVQAVMTFQKATGLTRDAVSGPQTLRSLTSAQPVTMPSHCEGMTACIDLKRQIMIIKMSGGVKAIGISSGSGKMYDLKNGGQARAVTPVGNFQIQRKIEGLRTADLGQLWFPSYFHKGWAVHGSGSVPAQPASHGCIRVPRSLERQVFASLPVGAKIHIS